MIELVKQVKLPTAYFENQIFMKCVTSQRMQLRGVMEAMGRRC